VEVDLQSKYGSGHYLFGLVDSLPDDAFDALIGNDFDPPNLENPLVSVIAVTRSQTSVLRQAVVDSDPIHRKPSRPILNPRSRGPFRISP